MDNSALMYYVFHIDRSRIKFAAISANPLRGFAEPSQRLRRTLSEALANPLRGFGEPCERLRRTL
jgi:hypothetical protein